jgi:hypothetical protein
MRDRYGAHLFRPRIDELDDEDFPDFMRRGGAHNLMFGGAADVFGGDRLIDLL